MLHQRFDEVMGVAASAVPVDVTLPWWLFVESTGAAASSASQDGGGAGQARGAPTSAPAAR